MKSSEQTRRTAPLKSPSSSLEATSSASDSIGSRTFWCFWRLWGLLGNGRAEGSDSTLICSLKTLARFYQRPPQLEARRQRELKRKRQSQAGMLAGLAITASIIEANFLAASSWEARGILRIGLTRGLGSVC